MPKNKSENRLIAQNKKAYHDYFILETFQAGIAGKCNLKESYIQIENNEAIIKQMHISPYEQGNIFNHDPLADRRLLLHKYEINKLIGAVTRDGYTIIPLKIYFKGSLVKVDIGIAKGKKLYDKRQDIAKKDAKRSAEKEFKHKLQL